jgi:hypothetical protein
MKNRSTLPRMRTCWSISGIALLLIATAAVADPPKPGAPPHGVEHSSGAEAKAEALIQQALLARLNGNETECHALLKQAREAAPSYPRTLWLLGHVRENDDWIGATEHQEVAASDRLLDEYEAMRREVILKPDRELQLARWCNQVGLDAQRDLHFGRLLVAGRLSKSEQKEAARLLNLELAGGQYWHKDELARMKENSTEAMASLKKWVPRLTNLEKDLQSRNPRMQARARDTIEEMKAAEILPAAEALLPATSDQLGSILVDALARDRAYPVTLALARYAVFSPAESVREKATMELAKRPQHEFIPFLLRSLNAPVKTQFAVYRSPDGSLRYDHLYLREGHEQNSLLHTQSAAYARADRQNNFRVTRRGEGIPGRREFRYADPLTTQLVAEAQLLVAAAHESKIAQDNLVVQAQNARIYPVLRSVTRQQLPDDPMQWWQWWEQHNELPKQRSTQVQRQYDQSTFEADYVVTEVRMSCFAPGTLVWTERGLKAIEAILPGDRVLSQHPDTGQLSYKTVIRPTVGPPSSGMSRMEIGDQELHITHAHVVWVQGKGWEIARRVNPGDRLASLQGSSTVTDLEDRPVPPLIHNLVVQDFHTFFVGEDGLLVHDITYMDFRQPTQALVPGLLASQVEPTK